jgi:hypothetical protein
VLYDSAAGAPDGCCALQQRIEPLPNTANRLPAWPRENRVPVLRVSPQPVHLHYNLMIKFAQIAVLAAVLVVCAQAISCNVGGSTGSCAPVDLPGSDTCIRCARSIGISTNGCSTTTTIEAAKCSFAQTSCGAGTFTTCQTANCNSCSKASAMHVPAFLLLAASVITLCF